MRTWAHSVLRMDGILFIIGFLGSISVWLTVIRPYALKHGQGYTTGASWGVTAWVDWEQAKEIAVKKGDLGMLQTCRLFLGLNFVAVAGFLLLVLG